MRSPSKVILNLIEKGIDLNIQNNNGDSALICLCKRIESEREKIIFKLIDLGCDLNLQNVNLDTALLWAAANKLCGVVSQINLLIMVLMLI